MSKRFRCPDPWALLLGALLGTAQASAGCASPEALLSVRLGSTERGAVVVRLERDGDRVTGLLLPPDVLRSGEQGYVAGRLDCDGVSYVQLNPDLLVVYREETQELRIRPVPARLGQQMVDVGQTLKRVSPPVIPALGVDFGAYGTVRYDLRGEAAETEQPDFSLGTAQAYVGVGSSAGRLSGYLGALYTRRTNGESLVQGRGTAQFTVSPEWTVYAAYNASTSAAQPAFAVSDFRGVTVTYQRREERVYPRLNLSLDTPAEISVYVNSVRLGVLNVGAGEVSLLNIPLDGQGANTIRLLVDTETGTSVREVDVPANAAGPVRQSLGVRATAGTVRGRGVGEFSVQYAPTPSLLVQAQGQATSSGALSGAVQARLARAGSPLVGSAGAEVTRLNAAAPLQAAVTTRLDYTRQFLSASALLNVPLAQPADGSLDLQATYRAQPWLLSGGVRTRFQPGTWETEVGATRLLGARGAASVLAALAPDRYRLQFRVSYLFGPALRVQAGAALTENGAVPVAALTYQPTPDLSLSLNASADDISASSSLVRGVQLDLQAGTRGAAAQVGGALSLANGRVQLSPALTQRGLLIRTGVPRLTLTIDGAPSVLTNAAGDAFVTSVTPGQVVVIRTDTRGLPLGVALVSSSLEVLPTAAGLTLVDWRDNFRVSSFVRFFWAPGQPAAAADLYLNGERIPLDDEGYGLVLRSAAARTGELRGGEDGTRRCAVRLPASAQEATCDAAPPPPP